MVEFSFYGIQIQASRDGSVNFDGFLGYALTFCLGKVMESPEIVEAVGQFYDKHAEPAACTDENLAVGEVLRAARSR